MITNLPNSDEYQSVAIECWVQAIKKVYGVNHYVDSLDLEEDLNQEIHQFSQPEYRTSVVLLHQGIEAILKSRICAISPYILIEGKRNQWPVLPNQKDKDFNDFFTIGPEDLLYTFSAIQEPKPSQKLIDLLEQIRKQRNRIAHGFLNQLLNPKDIIIEILSVFTEFCEKDTWWIELCSSEWDHPLASYYNTVAEQALFANRLDFILDLIGSSEFLKHSTFPVRQRRYICPECKLDAEKEYDEYYLRWAVLTPNEPRNTKLYCYNCGQETSVIRKACNQDCQGNVLTEDGNECLTCGYEQIT